MAICRNGLDTPATIQLKSGKNSKGSCIRCPNPPCQFYSQPELRNEYFEDFPADTTTKVCPTDAIQLDFQNGIPVIKEEKCILCGLCVPRCPVQAIMLTRRGAIINDAETDLFKLTGHPLDPDEVVTVTERFRKLPTTGVIADCDQSFAADVYARVGIIGTRTHTQFPNLIARNLMMALAVPFHIRRLGDTNVRIDGIFQSGKNRLGVAEIEFAEEAVLDAPRDILDDCAVLNARHGIPIQRIDPLIISLRLPNKRSEYWRVIQDVNKMLNIKISSITIGAMMLLLWSNHRLEGNPWAGFYADADSPTIESVVRGILGGDPCHIGHDLGWLGSIK